jgi:glycosyltransferase involved in cell wall biosynthesis
MQNDPLISIVIPVRNEGIRIKEAILSFINGRSRLFAIEFVVVDDGSVDGCCDNLFSFNMESGLVVIKVIRLNIWSGIPFCRNIGAKTAAAPIMIVTDANVRVGYGWDIPAFREVKPNIALCATIADVGSDWKGYGCLLDIPSMGIKWLKSPRLFEGYVPVTPCTGTVIYRDLFMKLGGFDTAMPVYGAAEPEFSLRLWLYGAQVKNVPDLVFHHRFRPSEERKPFLDQINLIQVKNYLRFGLLYLGKHQITEMLKYWEQSNPSLFYRALNELNQREIMQRRIYLKNNLTYNLEWFKKRFMLHNKIIFNNEKSLNPNFCI